MKHYLIILFISIASASFGQTPDAATLQETAKTFLKQGDYNNAIITLNKVLEQKPGDLEASRDLLFAYYLKRDFAKALEFGKPLADRTDADVQLYQLIGLVYKSIAENKEAEKLYKKGMTVFPQAGVLYSEYGDLIADKDPAGALKLWEKGIEVEPNHSSNYYFAAKQYAQSGNTLWSILYAEMFLNMESFTPRSTEIKNILLEQYKKYFTVGYTAPPAAGKRPNDLTFTKAVTEILNKQQPETATGINPETLTVVRTRFILDWYNKYAGRYPFRLFEHQKQLLQQGMFEAYNFWLFGPASNLKTYQTWQQYHQAELNEFLGFVRSKVFKVPQGQQYRNM